MPDEVTLRMYDYFMSGAVAFGYVVVTLFFFRFWQRTSDRLFVMFGLAFLILGVIRLLLVVLGQLGEDHFLYWFRLAAYLLILAAIIDKNLRK